jgi:hypothetical protein
MTIDAVLSAGKKVVTSALFSVVTDVVPLSRSTSSAPVAADTTYFCDENMEKPAATMKRVDTTTVRATRNVGWAKAFMNEGMFG